MPEEMMEAPHLLYSRCGASLLFRSVLLMEGSEAIDTTTADCHCLYLDSRKRLGSFDGDRPFLVVMERNITTMPGDLYLRTLALAEACCAFAVIHGWGSVLDV